jgi:hypothetical protein
MEIGKSSGRVLYPSVSNLGMRRFISAVGAVLFGLSVMSPQNNLPRYPNELPRYRFYSNAKWRSLEPLVSTIDDVRKVMGSPNQANDNGSYSEPYPGDAAAREPVFTYRLNRDWEILIYFVSSCAWKVPRDIPSNRLCSVELIPRKHVSFRAIQFPEVFKRRHIAAVDAQWDEYVDGTGLRYEVYTAKTPYGSDVPGDLNRIAYGPAEAVAQAVDGGKP